MVAGPRAARDRENILSMLWHTLAAYNRGFRTDYHGICQSPAISRYIINKVDAVTLIGIGSPCQFFHRFCRIIRGERESGMRYRIGIHLAVCVAETGLIKER